MRRLVGLGYRGELAHWLDGRPPEVGCLEITAEHFMDRAQDQLRVLSRHYPLFVHGLGLSLGTRGPLEIDLLKRFARVVDAAAPLWISEHVAFTRTSEVDLGHLNPVRATRESLQILSDHAREVADLCGKPLILENITSHVALRGEMTEPDFLNRLCDQAECGLLLDVTNLLVNSRNHHFDPLAWLDQIEPGHIVQLHVVGYSRDQGRWHDLHAEAIQEELFDLTEEVLMRAPVQAIIIERDENFPPPEELAEELRRLEAAFVKA